VAHSSRHARGDATTHRATPVVAAPTSAILIDDVRASRDSVADLLRRRAPRMDILTACTADAALTEIAQYQTQAALINMCSIDGLRFIMALRSAAPAVGVIAFAVNDSDADIIACAEAGVRGLILRDGAIQELKAAILGVARGEVFCPPRVVAALLRHVAVLPRRSGPDEAAHLTPREREGLTLIERGKSNKEIARYLGIEVRTVKNHVHNLLEKLQVARRGEAAAHIRSASSPGLEVLGGGTKRA
jgi:two-component system, NarL family, nitrate/nitrite response regulator NarL